MRIEKDFKEFIGSLNKNKVRYLIVVGFAYSFHAEPRFTKDIDIFIQTSVANAKKTLKTIEEFGFKNSGLKTEDFLTPDQIVQLGKAPVRIDIPTSIKGVRFEAAWKNRKLGKYGDLPAYFISKNDLIRNKLALKRPQDMADVERLKEI